MSYNKENMVNYGFVKVAAAIPQVKVADCKWNVSRIELLIKEAEQQGVQMIVFPELCISGYTCGDLFAQRLITEESEMALMMLLNNTRQLDIVSIVGMPLGVNATLINAAVVIQKGKILGVVPKTYLPNYGEFYEKRQFTPGSTEVENVTVCGQEVPFGTSLLFRCRQMPSFVLGVEICEDLWSALPPSTFHALAGATVIANLSASDETVGKAENRVGRFKKTPEEDDRHPYVWDADEPLDPLPPLEFSAQPDWFDTRTLPENLSNVRIIKEYEQLEAFIEKDEWIGDPVLVRKEELLTEMSSRVRNYDGRRGGADYLRAISQDIDVLLDFMG